MSNSLDTNTVYSFAALETRAAVGGMGFEGKYYPPPFSDLEPTIYAPRGAVAIRHATAQ